MRDEGAVNGEIEVSQSVRGVPVTEHDVLLFRTGMSAIWSAHRLALDARGEKKSLCFGLLFLLTVSLDVPLKPLFIQLPLHRYPQDPGEVGSWLSLLGPWLGLFYRRARGNSRSRTSRTSPRASDYRPLHRVSFKPSITLTRSRAPACPGRQVRLSGYCGRQHRQLCQRRNLVICRHGGDEFDKDLQRGLKCHGRQVGNCVVLFSAHPR